MRRLAWTRRQEVSARPRLPRPASWGSEVRAVWPQHRAGLPRLAHRLASPRAQVRAPIGAAGEGPAWCGLNSRVEGSSLGSPRCSRMGGEALEEGERVEDEVSRTVNPRATQPVDDLAVVSEREALGRDGRAGDAAAEVLEALAIPGIDAHRCVRGEAVQRGARGRVRGEQKAQPPGHREHPLAHRHLGQHVVDHVRGGLRHAPAAAGGAEGRAPRRRPRRSSGSRSVWVSFLQDLVPKLFGRHRAVEDR